MKLIRQYGMFLLVSLIFIGCGRETPAATTTPTRMGDLQRVAHLISEFDIEERPLPFPPETIGAKAGLHYVTTDEQAEILLFEMNHTNEFSHAMSLLAAEGIDIEAEAPYSFVGGNSAVLYIVRNQAAPEQREDVRWRVSAIVSALAGEE